VKYQIEIYWKADADKVLNIEYANTIRGARSIARTAAVAFSSKANILKFHGYRPDGTTIYYFLEAVKA